MTGFAASAGGHGSPSRVQIALGGGGPVGGRPMAGSGSVGIGSEVPNTETFAAIAGLSLAFNDAIT